MKNILGIHHVTAIASDAQRNVDFYTNVLGLRLVKRTVNFDDPQTYHLYYGDATGTPGTILTFFPWSSLAQNGKRGTGQATGFSFSVPSASLAYWKERLANLRVPFVEPIKRFGDEVLTLFDHDEFTIELVATESEIRPGWENGEIPAQHAIRGFHGITLSEQQLDPTAAFVHSALGFEELVEEEGRYRFQSGEGGNGSFVDVLVQPNIRRGSMGAGIIHHVAFRVRDESDQSDLRDQLAEAGHRVTDITDRKYFKSIYFREPGGFLFEVATDRPGFTIDELPEELGSTLQLPSWLEQDRRSIEDSLPPLRVKTARGLHK